MPYTLPNALSFSPWISKARFLETRLSEPSFRQPGLYLLAHFATPPEGPAQLDIPEIIYVGETTKQTIGIRLDQFFTSADKQKSGHSGGWTYLRLSTGSKLPTGDLHISILPVARDVAEHSGFLIKHIERAIIWNIIEKLGVPPVCNSI
ncbi:hypothetical protein [Nitrospirillum amazonense]|uniref:hypothetical protein n=1 Tax=Nitrospirillum amazonense TaxID=28077 RepID=UPI0024123E37|nr:hypothetical protein [Nitrospirillum amazonense]MDG3440235.1 hypothetical protein [Nitrospirillum amazonense]